MGWIRFLATLLALAASASAERPELAAALERLRSADVLERLSAERWLVAELLPQDSTQLLSAARGADAEVRTRIARALAADGRHLGLAADFAASQESELVQLGEQALAAQLEAWRPGLAQPWLGGSQARAELARLRGSSTWRPWRLERDGSAGEQLECLARHADLPVPVVLDPGVDPALRAQGTRSQPLEGAWDRLLVEYARQQRLELELADLDPGEPHDSVPALVRLRAPGANAVGSPAAALVAWVRSVASKPSLALAREQRARAAQALACSGWRAALDWLWEQAAGTADPALRDALLTAAARGIAVPGLAVPEQRQLLLAELDSSARLAELQRGGLLLEALAALQPWCGTDLAREALSGFEGLPARVQGQRLALLERLAPAGGVELCSKARAVLASGAPAALRRRALFALAAHSRALWAADPVQQPLLLADASGLLLLAQSAAEAEDLAQALLQAQAAPPEAWDASWPAALQGQSSVPAQLALLRWSLACGRLALAAQCWQRLAETAQTQASAPGFQATASLSSELARLLGGLLAEGRAEQIDALFARLSPGFKRPAPQAALAPWPLELSQRLPDARL